MSKQKKPTEAEMLRQQDEALAKTIDDFLEVHKDERDVTVLLAGHLRTQVIDPSTLKGATTLLKAHRDGLYDSIPEGDLDAMDLFNIIQNHIGQLDAAIQGLRSAVTPEAEVVDENTES